MPWPDPKCKGPHEQGEIYRRWQHTHDCNMATSVRTRYTKRIAEIVPADDKMIERARTSGAV